MTPEQDALELGERVADALMWENRIPIITRSLYLTGLGLLATNTDPRYHRTREALQRE